MKTLLLGAAVAAIAVNAYAQPGPSDAASAIRARQANYRQMAGAMKGINDQLHSRDPALPTIQANSRLILGFAPQVLRWFPQGTGAEARVPTRARPEIWADPAGFRLAGARLLAAARGLDAAARSGDIARVRTATVAVSRACGGCHDSYRAPEA